MIGALRVKWVILMDTLIYVTYIQHKIVRHLSVYSFIKTYEVIAVNKIRVKLLVFIVLHVFIFDFPCFFWGA